MKQLNNNQLTSVVGAGFWSDIRDRIRDSVSSSSSRDKNKDGSFHAYKDDNVSIDIGGPSLGGGKGTGVGIGVTIKF